MGKVYDEILKIIQEFVESDVSETDSLFDDLEFDSVQIIDLVLKIEELYNFQFDQYDELMDHMENVREFALYFEAYITGGGGFC